MTTANLSVGLKTQSAKQELLALKAWMQNEMKSVQLGLDVSSLEAALKGKRLNLIIDDKALTRDVSTAVKAGLGGHRIEFDHVGLTNQVRAAVAAGLGGAKLQVGAQATGGAPSIAAAPELKTLIQQILVPAVDELSKAAALVGGAARQAGISGSTSRTVQATSGYSYTDPTTGERIAYRRRLSNPEVALANITSGNQGLREQRELERGIKEGFSFGPNREQLEKLKRDYEETLASLQARSAGKVDARTLLGLPARDEMKAMGAQLAAQFREGAQVEALRARSAGRVDARTLLGLPSREEMAGLAAQLRGQMQSAMELSNLKARSAGKVDARTLLGLPSESEMSSFSAQLKAQLQTQEKGAGATRLSTEAHRAAARVMNDAHSAARGLAGSLDVLWVTWGNTAPIVAAAALGGAIRSVFVNGKDLQYQLQFVSSLTGEASVSFDRFGAAVRGSMVGPVEAAQAMRGLAQNGLSVREAFQALPDILNLATAGEMSLSEAALGATGVMAAFNLQVEDLGHVGDVFAKAAALSNTSVQGMVEAMKQASTVSDQYHVSLEETAASLAVMAKRNIEGTAAGTAFRNMMVELATPTERAREVMKKLGLDLYDSNKQLKSYSEILQQVREKTLLLNERSRLNVLNEIFGERGSKAVNAILSDFQLYEQTLDQVKNKSEGFAQSVAQALGETTEGKLKRLVQEFQLTTAEAFVSADNGVSHFLDTLRAGVSSNEFKHYLDLLVKGVMSLTQFLVENGRVVVATIVTWQGMQILRSIALWALELRAAYTGVEIAATGAAAASRMLLGAATGGIALITSLAAEFFLLRSHTDEATEAQQRFADAQRNLGEDLDRNIGRLAEHNTLLRRQVELMREGYSAEGAKALAEKDIDKGKSLSLEQEVARIRQQRADMQRDLDQREQDQYARMVTPEGALATDPEIDHLRARIQAVDESLKEATENMNRFKAASSMKEDQSNLQGVQRRIADMREFNRLLAERQEKMPKGKSVMDLAILDDVSNLSNDQFDALLKSRKAAMEGRLTNVEPTDRNAARNQRRLEEAQSRLVIAQLNDEKAAMKDYLKFRRDLDQARYNPSLFGPFMQAAAAEQRQIEETSSLLRLQTDHTARLREAKAKLSDPADRVNMDRQIADSEREIERLRKQLDYQQQIAEVSAQTRQEQAEQGFQKELSSLGVGTDKLIAGIIKKNDTKILDPATAAEYNAQLAVREAYAQKISEHEQAVSNAQAVLQKVQKEIEASSIEEAVAKYSLLDAAKENLATEQARLAIMKAQAGTDAQRAGQTARDQTNRAQEAGYGWDKFWNEYKASAESNAQSVYDIMKKTTRGMESMVVQFATTGKVSFKDFARSIAAEAARIMATRAIVQLLTLAASMFGGGGGGGGTPVNGSAGTGMGVNLAANGAVMTEYGPLPLRKYATGGIARTPQALIYGEGKQPEAYVPLPDGRTIPVTMQGSGNGGVVQANVAVHLHGDGSSQVESDASGEKARQLGELIKIRTLETIAEQKRPGGALYGV